MGKYSNESSSLVLKLILSNTVAADGCALAELLSFVFKGVLSFIILGSPLLTHILIQRKIFYDSTNIMQSGCASLFSAAEATVSATNIIEETSTCLKFLHFSAWL
ncbi:hypothetical protein CRENBAI_003130 [Crenichthys baileyi]|uniref:Uncharacterized protein n=1 Tax=Crenichthys baileyi TaxID=28760 RepID=A0AAV9SN03_9TELE